MATSTQEWIEELKGISVLELAERIKALARADEKIASQLAGKKIVREVYVLKKLVNIVVQG